MNGDFVTLALDPVEAYVNVLRILIFGTCYCCSQG